MGVPDGLLKMITEVLTNCLRIAGVVIVPSIAQCVVSRHHSERAGPALLSHSQYSSAGIEWRKECDMWPDVPRVAASLRIRTRSALGAGFDPFFKVALQFGHFPARTPPQVGHLVAQYLTDVQHRGTSGKCRMEAVVPKLS